MAENTTSLVDRYPRKTSAASAPELWIPYVMIGVSCVTFLAAHFYCYHKRNRQRYLRKRDEKRVKCGLLERRRITTLMVARYQSNLGLCPNDSSSQVNHHHYYNKPGAQEVGHRGNHHDIYSLDTCDDQSSPLSGADGTCTPDEDDDVPRPAFSRSWPLVSERTVESSNAHSKTIYSREETNDVDCGPDSKRVATDSSSPFAATEDSATDEEEAEPTRWNVPQQYGYTGHRYVPRRHYAARPPPASYPNVYYGNLPTSHFTSPSPLFFKLKQKRHYDGVPVDEMSEIYKPHDHHLIHDRGEVSSPFYDDGDLLQQYVMTASDRGDEGFGYGSRGPSHYHHTVLDASGFAVSEDEAYPFSDFRNEYDVDPGLSDFMIPNEVRRVHNNNNKLQVKNHHSHHSPVARLPVIMSGYGDTFHNENRRTARLSVDQKSKVTESELFKVHSRKSNKAGQLPGHYLEGWNHCPPRHHSKANRSGGNMTTTTNSLPKDDNCKIISNTNVLIASQLSAEQANKLTDRLPYLLTDQAYLEVTNKPRAGAIASSIDAASNGVFTSNHTPLSTSPLLPQRQSTSPAPVPIFPHSNATSSVGHSTTSPRHTPVTGYSDSSSNHTPSTPGSGSSLPPHTPPLRTLNPDLVFQYAKRKTTMKSE